MPRRGPHNNAITWTPHVKVAWGGPLGTSGEIWTNSVKFVHLAQNTVLTAGQVTAMNPGVWAALAKWIQSSGNFVVGNAFIGQDAKLEWLKINSVAESGLQYQGATNVYEGGSVAGSDNNTVPFYQTFAITLRSQLKRGRAHSGRIFPPVVQPAMELGTGYTSLDMAHAMAQAFETCLAEMTTAIRAASSVGSFSVLSPGDTTKGTTPMSQIITGVVVDRVPDVQHRRTRQLPRAEGPLVALPG